MNLTALDPPPAALEPTAPPPWPEPTGTFVEPTLPQESTGCGFLAAALVPTAMGLFSIVEGNYGFTKIAAVLAVVLAVLGLWILRGAKALKPAHRERFARCRRSWARIKSSTVKGEHKNRGVLSHYTVEVDLEIWEPASATHRTAPMSTSTKLETRIPAALSAQVLPGAFFAVMFDPVERTAMPFTLLTREGAQLPIS
jgi:hypothetical protein